MDGSWVGSAARRWYAVRSQPQREKLAAQHLRRQGFGTFLPTYRKAVRRPTRMDTVIAPFFPGYLFVALSLELDRWRSVNNTIGVQRLVSFADVPAPAPHGMVEALRANASDDGDVQFNDDLSPGDPVRLVGGPLNGCLGVFAGASEGDRVSILMTILAREVKTRVPRGQVMRA